MHNEERPMSFWVTVAFTLNYSLGSGFLTLPWAFSLTGTLLGVVVLVVFGAYSMLATFYLLETIDRARHVHSDSSALALQALNRKNYVSISSSEPATGNPLGAEEDNAMPSRGGTPDSETSR
eukprot:gene46428-56858_t